MDIKMCLCCKKVFVQQRATKKYCSESCRVNHYKKQKRIEHKQKLILAFREQMKRLNHEKQ